jgi:hypothetical protein
MITLGIGKSHRAALGRVFGIAAALALLLVAACKDSNTVAGNSSPDLTGSWAGTYTPNAPAFYAEASPAQASFQRSGNAFDGTITVSGSAPITIHGTLSGSSLYGSFVESKVAGSVYGTLQAPASLRIDLNPPVKSQGGELQLHR